MTMMSGMRFMIFGFYVFAFWVGSQIIRDGRLNYDGETYNAGTLLSVTFSPVLVRIKGL